MKAFLKMNYLNADFNCCFNEIITTLNAHTTPHSPNGDASPHTLDCAMASPPLGGWGVRDGKSFTKGSNLAIVEYLNDCTTNCFFVYLTPDPSPIGEGSTPAEPFGSSLGGALRLGSPAFPRKRAPFPASGKGRGWGISGEKTETIAESISA
jgi:hypothetical protein